MSVRNDQLDAAQAAPRQLAQEAGPERLLGLRAAALSMLGTSRRPSALTPTAIHRHRDEPALKFGRSTPAVPVDRRPRDTPDPDAAYRLQKRLDLDQKRLVSEKKRYLIRIVISRPRFQNP